MTGASSIEVHVFVRLCTLLSGTPILRVRFHSGCSCNWETVATEKPYPSLDDQILACIEAAKASYEEAKLEDFQLRVAANDLILFNLKTGESSMLYDVDSERLEYQAAPSASLAARSPRRKASTGTRTTAKATVSPQRLTGWIAERQTTVSPRAR
jgi:hypothetical protein